MEETKISLGEFSWKYGLQGCRTVRTRIKEFVNFDWQNRTPQPMGKSKDHDHLHVEHPLSMSTSMLVKKLKGSWNLAIDENSNPSLI